MKAFTIYVWVIISQSFVWDVVIKTHRFVDEFIYPPYKSIADRSDLSL